MPTYSYGPVQNGAITIQEEECTYQMTAEQLVTEIADLKESRDRFPRFTDEQLFHDCLALLEGAPKRLQENAPLQDLRQ